MAEYISPTSMNNPHRGFTNWYVSYLTRSQSSSYIQGSELHPAEAEGSGLWISENLPRVAQVTIGALTGRRLLRWSLRCDTLIEGGFYACVHELPGAYH